MKRKVIFIYILLAVLFCAAALAEGDTDAGLTVDELMAWVKRVVEYQKANLNTEPAIEETELGFQYKYGGIELIYDSKDPEKQKLTGLRLSEPLLEGPRGERLNDVQTSLLAHYPNDNPQLIGDKDFAFLYIDNELPERASWGFVTRDGQRLRSMEYVTHQLIGDAAYSNLKFQLELEHASLASIAVYGIGQQVEQSAVLENIAYAESLRELRSYHAYKTSTNGTELSPFEREDLSFSGLDYLSLTPEFLIERFGEPDLDETSSVDEQQLRTLSWDAIDATFVVDAAGKAVKAYRFSIRDDILEGPRGLRVGDSFPSVYSRFRSSGNEADENNVEILYGSLEEGSFGAVSYYPNGIEVSMQTIVQLDSGEQESVVLNLEFEVDKLREITIYTNQSAE